ncbi:related to ubiquitin-conjugating enzyme E2 4 [Phialocephala subalpina]|uniref:Related to ubiquitin-conjugating enzyme E2 4 n=1 Tax=Phialocephala subalpina TaxID=576137 RepID=A0A1L7WER4_9HELO|nr:related to ubiquitin-conjugating enzyme E2 4 [Phialocephala subalpina]
MSGPKTASSRTPTKRILTELTAFSSAHSPSSPHPNILSLVPLPSNLLSLRCILSGHTLPPTSGYTTGRWLLSIQVPPQYPNQPPTITFVTKICHANVKWETGEICLDVLKENWTPVLGVVGALESVVRLLGEPGVDSPLNVEMGALLRQGDTIGARGLVGYWCGEERFEGHLDEEEEGGSNREEVRGRGKR